MNMNQYSGRQARPQASINSLKWLWLACQALFLLSSMFTTLPSYADTRISVGDHHACVIRADDTVRCWGNLSSPEENYSPEGKFTQVSVNKLGKGSCGLRTDNTISCWGGEIANIPVPSGKFIQVNFDQRPIYHGDIPYSACAIRLENNKIICWDTSGNLFEPSQEKFLKIGLNSDAHVGCGILTDKSISCWGLPDLSSGFQPPAGKFSQVLLVPVALSTVMGSYYVICGLTIEGHFVCTIQQPVTVSDLSITNKDYLEGLFQTGTDKSFYEISAHYDYMDSLYGYVYFEICGLRKGAAIDRLLTCWGVSSKGAFETPVVGFVEISVGLDYGCGIKPDNTVSCWGVSYGSPTKEASFTVDRNAGSSPLTVEVDASQSISPADVSEYTWKITNVNTGVEPVSPKLGNQAKGELTFTEPGSYQVDLIVVGIFGGVSIAPFQRIEVSNSPPTATMKILSNIKGKIPLSVKLDASDSVDSDGKIQNYSWHIREDDSIVIDNAKIPKPFTLSKAGTYTVVLTVTDDRWATASTEQTIIAQAEDNRLPVAKIKAQTSTQGVAPLTVRFDGSSSSDVDGQLTDYEWMVSDGRESVKGNDAFPSLLFNRVGDYTITLKVTDNSGGSSTDTMKVTVTDGCVATYSPESGNGRVQIPCVAVEGQPLSGYEVILWQHNLANAFLFDLNLSSSTYLKTKKLPDESKCKAIYNSQSGELHIPCVQYGEKSFDVYLLLRLNMSSDFFMTFGLDDNRVKINP